MTPRLTWSLSGQASFAAIAGLAGFAIALFAPQIFNDGDTYWHIRAGEWMLTHHTVLRYDPFSYSMAGAPWDAQEWLAEIVMALAWRIAAWNGLHILFGAATGATCFILAAELRRRLTPETALMACVLGLGCVAGSLLARPHLLALPLAAVWSVGLVRARDEDRVPSLWLLPLMPLWANLHASFLFGLALAAALGLEAVIESPKRRSETVRGWILFLLAAIATAVLTPQGLNGLLFPLKLMALHSIPNIGEWRAANFEHLSPFEIALLATVFVFMTRDIRTTAMRALILLGLVYFSLQHVRHQMLLGITGPLLLAKALHRPEGVPADKETAHRGAAFASFAVIAPLLVLALLSLRLYLPSGRSDDPVSPMTALAGVPASLRQQPVLNDYSFGGYLIFEGVRPFVDSRAELYGDRFLDDYAAITMPDRTVLAATIKRYGIRWAIFGAKSPVIAALDALPHWRRLHGDPVAVVYAQDAEAPAGPSGAP